uniref:Ionotropic glutamate receptor C-terminal domain-containing protein n=1 Tax=Anopheles atroparvus TaxID=41427 RepID=A0A182IVC3_ANOAO
MGSPTTVISSIFVLIIVLLVGCCRSQSSVDQMAKTSAMMRAVCNRKHKASEQLVDGLGRGEFADNKDLKCYANCVLEMMQAMKKGKITADNAIKQIELLIPSGIAEPTYYSFCTIGRDFLQNVPVAKILLTDDDDLEAKLIYAIDNGCQAFVEEDEWGDIYPNGSGIGLLGSVSSRRTDIALAAIYLWSKPYNFTDYTVSVSRSGITALVPKPRMLPFWRTPLLSFSWPLWTAVAITFVVGSLVAWVVGRGRYRLLVAISGQAVSTSEQLSSSEVVMVMVGFFVAQSSPMRNDLWSCVFLFSSLLLAGFMVSNLYSGGLASVMTVPQYEKSIDTVIDFAESGIQWFGPTPYFLAAIDNATEPHLRQIRSTYKVASIAEKQRHARAVDGGFIIEQAQHGNFAPSDFLDRESSTKFQVLRDDIYFQYCIAVMPKMNPLRNSLNEHILQVQQSGMLYHWGTMAAIRYLPTDMFRNIEQARLHRNDGGQAVTLQIDHFLVVRHLGLVDRLQEGPGGCMLSYGQ